MKKVFFGALSIVFVATLFSFTDPVAKCYTSYRSTGEDNGDACVSQNCVFKEKVSFFQAQWADCGNAQ